MRCIFTNRTIGITSFSIGTNRTIGTNGPSVCVLCILDMCGVQITTQNMKRREASSVITQQNHD